MEPCQLRYVGPSNQTNPDVYWTALYVISADFAFAFLLGLLVIFILTVLKYSQTASFNRLTLRPYYILIGYSILSCIQFVMTAEIQSRVIHTYFINVNKINCIYSAIGFQIYEWVNAYLIIDFQKEYTIVDVHIEKRKFVAREKRAYVHFLRALFSSLLLSNAAILIGYFLDNNLTPGKPLPSTNIKFWITHVYNLATWAFLAYALIVFPITAAKTHRTSWLEYRTAFYL
jgi:hypothetical protein